jgi:4-amino-4-deoxy-L-arabinose transferase-like glycosyltransferase
MAHWLRALGALSVGLAALALLWGERFAYGDFLPLRGYQEIHGHLMAPQEGLFLGLYTVLGTIAALGLGLFAHLAVRRSVWEAVQRLSVRFSDRGWLAIFCAVTFISALVVGFVVLEQAFLTDDEMAMLFQAQTMLMGRLWVEPTPFVDVLNYAMIIESPRWYGIYPPGHPAVMALSLLLTGDARPLLAVVAVLWVLGTFSLARHLFDRSTALLATALLCLSPFFLLSSGSMASELTSGLLLLLAMNAALRLEGPRPYAMAVALGLCLGAASLTRPYTALVFGLPLGAWVAWRWFHRATTLFVPFVSFLCAAPFAVIYLWMNAELTGSPWLTPYEVNFPGRFWLGFGQDAFGIIHTPQLALAVFGLTIFELNAWSLGWPFSLAPVAAAIGLARLRGAARLLFAVPLFVLLAFMIVPMAGVHDTGPIYYLEVLPLIVILAARGMIVLGERVGSVGDGSGRDRLAWFAIAACLVGALVFWQQQIDMLRALSQFNRAPYDIAEETIDGRALVFIEEIQTTPPSSWVLGIRPPSPDMNDRILYGDVVGQHRAAEVLRAHPDRRGYFLSRDQRSGDVSIVPLPSAVAR